MQLSFSLDGALSDPKRSPSGVIDEVKSVTVESSSDAATAKGLPDDISSTLQAAFASAESVAAYYAPLGQALDLVDRVLNAVETVSEVGLLVNARVILTSKP
jgi:hypothetical protein